MTQTKKEIRAMISELEQALYAQNPSAYLYDRIQALSGELDNAPENFMDRIIDSHRHLCKAKNMGLKEAYGNEPIMYYSAGVAGEAGELIGGLCKAARNGYNYDKFRQAVIEELPDVYIYGCVLAYVADINLEEEILKKVDMVVKRADDGYYGPPLEK